MDTTRTTVEFSYSPDDYFEAPMEHETPEYKVVIDAGRAIATLSAVQDRIDESLLAGICRTVRLLFQGRQVLTHRPIALSVGGVRQWAGKMSKGVTFHVIGSDRSTLTLSGEADVVLIRDGKVIYDSKSDRMAGHRAWFDGLIQKAPSYPVLQSVLASYGSAVEYPDHELVHLYEIREALAKHFGNESTARATLDISKSDWQLLGRLANDEPIDQGRHKGKHLNRTRPASAEELAKARMLIRHWIGKLIAIL